MECAAIPDAADPPRQLAERPCEEPGVCAAAQITDQSVRLPGACRGRAGQHPVLITDNAMLTMTGGEKLLQHLTSTSGVFMQHRQLAALHGKKYPSVAPTLPMC